MKHLKLYEDFNPHDSLEFAEKLRIYALASLTVKGISPLIRSGTSLTFTIVSTTPSDSGLNISFVVYIPLHEVNGTKIVTVKDGKETKTDRISPPNENDLEVIVTNFIEVTSLYDDTVISYIVEAYDKIHTPADVKAIIAKLGQ